MSSFKSCKLFAWLLIFFLLVPNVGYSQENKTVPDVINKDAAGLYVYQNVIEVPEVNQSELYDRVKKWIVGTLKTSDNNIFLDDQAKKLISTSATILLERHETMAQRIEFKISFSFKDGKIKVDANQFLYVGTSPFGNLDKPLEKFSRKQRRDEKMLKEFFEKFQSLMNSLEKEVKAGSEW